MLQAILTPRFRQVGHPIHFHGHDFVILAQSNDVDFEPHPAEGNIPSNLNLTNPVRRDVAVLPADGTLIIAFRTDNPGIWLMHCHM